ncbi:MAG: hypothetical protein L0Z53_22315, partial [Acidobacteriales bacterium]|nr:hypothetical protein [Terriglobales bacterium]
WLDEEALKSRFFALANSAHPDRVHALPEADRQAATRRYTELNSAFNCLREPRDRLRHLLELETGRKPAPVGQVPPAMANLFFDIGNVCRQADDFLKRKAATNSPLLLASLFDEGQTISESLTISRQDLAARQQQLLDELRNLNPHWHRHLNRLEEIHQALTYLNRWSAQLQERIVRLAL